MNTSASTPSFLSGFSQIAYVTNDTDRALQVVADKFGIRQFDVKRGLHFDANTTMDLALAYVGPVMIEIICARGSGETLYEVGLPTDRFALQFHHVGHVVEALEEWRALRERVAAGWLPVAIANDDPDGDYPFMYLDARAELGHYLEFSLLNAKRRAMYAQIPRN